MVWRRDIPYTADLMGILSLTAGNERPRLVRERSRNKMKRFILLLCAVLLPIFWASQALGHGGGDTMGDWDAADACTAVKGHYTVHFTAYQELVGAGMIPLLHGIRRECFGFRLPG